MLRPYLSTCIPVFLPTYPSTLELQRTHRLADDLD